MITFFVVNLVQQAMAYRYFRLHSVLKIFYQVDVLVLHGPGLFSNAIGNVIDRALHLLQGEANAVAEGMKDVAPVIEGRNLWLGVTNLRPVWGSSVPSRVCSTDHRN